MSSVLVEYPEGLPAPSVGEVKPTERRTISSVGQIRNTRTIQRDRHGTRTVAFTFTPAQAAIFREWWVEWLQLGGGWFSANWPLPWSRGPNVFRFTDPPQWNLIGGRLDGQGYWQVKGTCEIRGRGMLPTAEVMYLTSTPYPIEVIEGMGLAAGNVRELPTLGYVEAFGLGASVITATAWNGFQKINLKPEGFDLYARVISASSIETIYSKITLKPEGFELSAKVISANSYIGLVTYGNYPKEGFELSARVIGASSTGV